MITSSEQQKLNQEVELAEESQARALVYNFLSSLFAKEVTSDLVTQLTSTQGQSFLNSLALEPSLTVSLNEINAKLNTLNSKELLLELAADFCGLFLVDGRTCASPYAGQYSSDCLLDEVSDELENAARGEVGGKKKKEKIQIFGELHQKMTEFLTENKLQVHSDFPEPADHIAVILAYIAHLCVTTEHREQLIFINRYLMTWINEFTQQVNKHEHGVFYSSVANLTLKWLEIEIKDLKNIE